MPLTDDLFGGLLADDETTDWKILDKLLDKADIEMKTEIKNPLAVSKLRCIAAELDRRGMKKASEIITAHVDNYLLNMVSYDRKRANEIVDGFRLVLAHNERMKQNDPYLLGGEIKK